MRARRPSPTGSPGRPSSTGKWPHSAHFYRVFKWDGVPPSPHPLYETPAIHLGDCNKMDGNWPRRSPNHVVFAHPPLPRPPATPKMLQVGLRRGLPRRRAPTPPPGPPQHRPAPGTASAGMGSAGATPPPRSTLALLRFSPFFVLPGARRGPGGGGWRSAPPLRGHWVPPPSARLGGKRLGALAPPPLLVPASHRDIGEGLAGSGGPDGGGVAIADDCSILAGAVRQQRLHVGRPPAHGGGGGRAGRAGVAFCGRRRFAGEGAGLSFGACAARSRRGGGGGAAAAPRGRFHRGRQGRGRGRGLKGRGLLAGAPSASRAAEGARLGGGGGALYCDPSLIIATSAHCDSPRCSSPHRYRDPCTPVYCKPFPCCAHSPP